MKDSAATAPDIEDSVEMIPYKGEKYSEVFKFIGFAGIEPQCFISPFQEEMTKRSSDFFSLMSKRRTLRFFSPEPVT